MTRKKEYTQTWTGDLVTIFTFRSWAFTVFPTIGWFRIITQSPPRLGPIITWLVTVWPWRPITPVTMNYEMKRKKGRWSLLHTRTHQFFFWLNDAQQNNDQLLLRALYSQNKKCTSVMYRQTWLEWYFRAHHFLRMSEDSEDFLTKLEK